MSLTVESLQAAMDAAARAAPENPQLVAFRLRMVRRHWRGKRFCYRVVPWEYGA